MICTSAWTDVNINLGLRTVSYCCLSKSYPLDLNNIASNKYIDKARSELAQGIKSSHCDYCWKLYEKTGSAPMDTRPQWEKAEDIKNKVRLIEIRLDNFCDMSCIYCCSYHSHTIAKQENEENIFYSSNREEYSKVIEWIKTVEQPFRLSFIGGEPTFSKNFYTFFELLLDSNIETLHFSFITNGNTTGQKREKLRKLIDRIPPTWSVEVILSNESIGRKSELVRYGLDWNTYEENVKYYNNHPAITKIRATMTVSRYTANGIYDYMKWLTDTVTKPLMASGNMISEGPYAVRFSDYIDDYEKCKELAHRFTNSKHVIKWLDTLIRLGSTKSEYDAYNDIIHQAKIKNDLSLLDLTDYD
jgi:organic radical activating enzyme